MGTDLTFEMWCESVTARLNEYTTSELEQMKKRLSMMSLYDTYDELMNAIQGEIDARNEERDHKRKTGLLSGIC